MAGYIPKFGIETVVTFTAGATVTGGRVVAVTGDREVSQAGADAAAAIGVAARDAKAGEQVSVFVGRGVVHRLPATAAITAGAKVATAAAGKVAPIGAATNVYGIALTSAAAADDVVEVLV